MSPSCSKKLNITRFHFLMFCIWQFGLIFAAQQLFPIFFNYQPKRECADLDELNQTNHKSDKCQSHEKQCDALKGCKNITKHKAPFYSMVEQFELFCDRSAYYATIISTVQFVGVLVGTLIYGHLGDHFGRKPVTLAGLTIGITAGCLSGVAPTWPLFAVTRFFVGTTAACVLIVLYTYVCELILPEQRVFLRTFFNWGYARVVLTLVCYLLPRWRVASIVGVCVALPIVLVIAFIVPESPKWLDSKGRHAQAVQARRRIARFSGVKIETEMEKVTIDQQQQAALNSSKTVYTIRDLLRHRKTAMRTLVLCFLWFSTSLITFGTDLSSGNTLSGNLFVNQFLFSFAIAFSKIFAFLFDNWFPRFNRRHFHQIPLAGGLLSYAAIMGMMIIRGGQTCSDSDNFLDWMIIIVNVIAMSLVEITWDACYLCAVESFPTETRTIGMGTCSLMARIGALLAPQMAYLSNIYKPAPYAVVCAAALASLLVSFFFLPDTKGIELAAISLELENNKNKQVNINNTLK